MSLGTTAPAPTSAPARMTARCRTTAPVPTSAPSSTVQPSRWTRCAITQSLPMTVGNASVQWITAPSWIDVRSPTEIHP